MTPGWLGVLALLASAFVVAIALTPAVMRAAQRFGFVETDFDHVGFGYTGARPGNRG